MTISAILCTLPPLRRPDFITVNIAYTHLIAKRETTEAEIRDPKIARERKRTGASRTHAHACVRASGFPRSGNSAVWWV